MMPSGLRFRAEKLYNRLDWSLPLAAAFIDWDRRIPRSLPPDGARAGFRGENPGLAPCGRCRRRTVSYADAGAAGLCQRPLACFERL